MIPREPEHYTPTQHVIQRVKYRQDPPIDWVLISSVIETGEVRKSPKYGESAYQITGVESIKGSEHSIRVGVNPEKQEIMTAYCFCHKESLPDCYQMDK